jgi:hypothetical protein
MVEPAVEFRIIAPILDHAACVRDRRPVSREQRAHLGEAQPANHMGEIHRHLPRERGAWRASRSRFQVVHVHFEHGCDGGVDDLP